MRTCRIFLVVAVFATAAFSQSIDKLSGTVVFSVQTATAFSCEGRETSHRKREGRYGDSR
jgi:hypothetical protein